MADKRITGLPALTTISKDDVLLVVDDPAGTPTNKKISIQNFFSNVEPQITFANVSEASNSTTASVKFSGGVGVSKNMIIDGNVTVNGVFTMTGNGSVSNITSNISPGVTITYDVGNTTTSWKDAYVQTLKGHDGALAISANTTASANLTVTGANVYINGTQLTVDSNASYTANLTTTTDSALAQLNSVNTHITSNTTIAGTNTVITSNTTIEGANATIAGTNAHITSNTTLNGTNTVIASNSTLNGANTNIAGTNAHITSNSTIAGTNTDISSNTTLTGANLNITGTNTNITSNVTITAEDLTVNPNASFTANITVAGNTILTTDSSLIFRDSDLRISSASDGELSINADSKLILDTTSLNVSSNTTLAGTNANVTANLFISGANTRVTSANLTFDSANFTVNTGNFISNSNISFTSDNTSITGDNTAISSNVTISGTDMTVSANVSASANVRITSAIDSTTNTTGALTVTGGVGVAKKVTIGENLLVHGNIHANGNITVDGDLTLGNADTDSVSFGATLASDIIPTTIVGSTTQSTGSGLDDITFQGTYTGATAVTYYVKIDATGTPDTFSWSKDNFSTTEATGVSLTGSAQTLDSGVTVTASATTGHTLNDVWQMSTISAHDLGNTINRFANAYIDDLAVTSNVTVGSELTVTANTTLSENTQIATDKSFIFRDSAIRIFSAEDGNMTVNADANVTIDSADIRMSGGDITIASNTTSSANVRITSAIDSTTNTTGALTVTGGVGVAKKVTIGENLLVHGNIHANGNITSDGDLTLGNADTDTVTFGADLGSSILPTTDSSYDLGNTTNRFANAYIDDLAVTSNVTVGTELTVSANTTLSDNTQISTDKSLIFRDSAIRIFSAEDGNMTVNADANVTLDSADIRMLGGDITIASNTTSSANVRLTSTVDSTTNTTGALTVTGGVGVAKKVTIGENLLVHGNIHANGNITADGNLTLGSDDTDSVSFGADLASSILPTTDSSYDLGNTTNRFANAYIDDIIVTSNVVSARLESTANASLPSIETTNSIVSVTSNTTFTSNVTIGVDDAGHDFKVFTATSGKHITVDESLDLLTVNVETRFEDVVTANGTFDLGENGVLSFGRFQQIVESTTGVATVDTISTSYSDHTNATYTNVSLTGGSGSGAKATVVVESGAISSVTLTTVGSGYAIDDTLTISSSVIGGGGDETVDVATLLGTSNEGNLILEDATGETGDKFLTEDIARDRFFTNSTGFVVAGDFIGNNFNLSDGSDTLNLGTRNGSASGVVRISNAYNLPNTAGANGTFLKLQSGNLVFATGTGINMTDLVDDTTPQLGGALDLNTNQITDEGQANTVISARESDGLVIIGDDQTSTFFCHRISNGRHGINTTTPDASLQIAGTLNVSSLVTFSSNFNMAGHNLTDTGLKLAGTLVTASAAELNILDGVTSTATELNVLDGISATLSAADLSAVENFEETISATSSTVTIATGKDFNIAGHDLIDNGLKLGGTLVTASAAEINKLDGVTASTAELNYAVVSSLGLVVPERFLHTDSSKIISFTGLGGEDVHDGQMTIGNVICTDTTTSTSNSSGSLRTAGGFAVKKNAYIGQKLVIQGNTTFSANATYSGTVAGNEMAWDKTADTFNMKIRSVGIGTTSMSTSDLGATANNVLVIGNGVAPTSFAADQAYLYAKDDGGESHIYTCDEGGTSTRLGAHNSEGEWEFYSYNNRTGKTVRINMEKMIKKLEEFTGETFIENE